MGFTTEDRHLMKC